MNLVEGEKILQKEVIKIFRSEGGNRLERINQVRRKGDLY